MSPGGEGGARPSSSESELPRVTLRSMRSGDEIQLRRWLQSPEVQRWWGSAASASAQIRLAIENPTAICRIIAVADTPVGYAHALEAVAAGESDDASDAGAWSCDLFIGSEAHRGRGFGQAALDLLAREVFETTLAVACTVLVSIRNERAARAYEKIGFRWTAIRHDGLLGPCWLMRRERPGTLR